MEHLFGLTFKTRVSNISTRFYFVLACLDFIIKIESTFANSFPCEAPNPSFTLTINSTFNCWLKVTLLLFIPFLPSPIFIIHHRYVKMCVSIHIQTHVIEW